MSSWADVVRNGIKKDQIHALNSGADLPPPDPPEWFKGDVVKATTDKLFSEGFPPEMVQMFKKTADETNAVIMSRAPGDATPELIQHGHDLKGYQVKAKSCNWGPMSGFLCQMPCLNKKGADKIDYNDEKYLNYFKYIHEKQKTDIAFRNSVAREEDGFTPFIPLKIIDSRKVQMLQHKSILYKKTDGEDVYGIAAHSKKEDGNEVQTVWMEFLLTKDTETASDGSALWQVYHGRIHTIDPEGKKDGWLDFFDAKISYMEGKPGEETVSDKTEENGGRTVRELLRKMPENLVPNPKDKHKEYKASKTAIKSLTDELKKRSMLLNETNEHPGFRPLCVAQNPTPAYAVMEKLKDETDKEYGIYKTAARKDLYKNAVTGDYDLFAVWPVRPKIGWEDMVRLSDLRESLVDRNARKKAHTDRKPFKQSFFVSVPGKPFGLGLRGSPNAYIDVIPGFDEIKAWEDPELGNVNEAVMFAAQTLNSFVTAFMLDKLTEGRTLGEPSGIAGKERHFAYPNVAFHSDEGGRPGIDEIDLPVGVFLPLKLCEIPEVQRVLNPAWKEGGTLIRHMVIDNQEYERFLGLALALRKKCRISFNHVWMTYLFALVEEVDREGDFFKPFKKERKEIGPQRLALIRAQLSRLFIGGAYLIDTTRDHSAKWGIKATGAWPKEAADAQASLDELSKAFVDAVDETKADQKVKILKAAQMSIPDRNSPDGTAKSSADDSGKSK